MGQNAHRKFKAFEKAKQENKRFPSFCSNDDVRKLELEWKLQEMEDKRQNNIELEWYRRQFGN